MKTYYIYKINKNGIVVPYITEVYDLIDCEVLSGSIQEIPANNAIEALLKAGIDEGTVINILIEELEFSGLYALIEFNLIGKEFGS